MRRVLLLFALVGVGGCSEPAEQGDPLAAADSLDADTTVVLPDHPVARRGRFVAVSTGEYDLSGAWQAVAGRCDSLALLQVLASDPTTGAIVLLRLPADSLEGPYPIVVRDSVLPPPPSSQVGVQHYGAAGSRAFQADSGAVDITVLGDRVTGRLKVVLREITNRQRIGYAAVFEGVPVTPLDSARCGVAGAGAGAGTAAVP